MQIGAVQVDIGRAILRLDPIATFAFNQYLAGLEVLGQLARRDHAEAAHPLLKPEVDHDPAGIGAEGNPGPNLTQLRRLFIDRDAQARLDQRQRTGQAA